MSKPTTAADLVEVQCIQQVCQLPVLLLLVQHHIVLHQTVQRQLALIINVDLCWLQTARKAAGNRQQQAAMQLADIIFRAPTLQT